jgi:hypothetical protein
LRPLLNSCSGALPQRGAELVARHLLTRRLLACSLLARPPRARALLAPPCSRAACSRTHGGAYSNSDLTGSLSSGEVMIAVSCFNAVASDSVGCAPQRRCPCACHCKNLRNKSSRSASLTGIFG